MHVLRDARRGVQGDRSPDRFDVVLRDAAASQGVAGGVRAVDFEAFLRAAVLVGQAHVVKHRAGIEQFRIEPETAALARQSAPVIDAARMVEEQRRFGFPHQFGYFAGELAVGNLDSGKLGAVCKVDVHWTVVPIYVSSAPGAEVGSEPAATIKL